MSGSISRRWLAMLALTGALLAMCVALLFASAPKAEAVITPYCNNILYAPGGHCWGAQRNHYATYGWGDHGGVCVWSSWQYGGPRSTTSSCSGQAGVGAYNPYGQTLNFFPGIDNIAGVNNRLHGAAYQP